MSVLCLLAAARTLLFEANLHFYYWAQVSVFGVLAARLSGRRAWPVVAAAAGARLWTADPIDTPVIRLYQTLGWHPDTEGWVAAGCWWLVLLPLAAVMVWPAGAAVMEATRSKPRTAQTAVTEATRSKPLRGYHAAGAIVLAAVCLVAVALPAGSYLRITPAVLWDARGLIVRSEQQQLFDEYVADKADYWTENNGRGPGVDRTWIDRVEAARRDALRRCDRDRPGECEAEVTAATASAWRQYWASLLNRIRETAHVTDALRGYPDTGPLQAALSEMVDSLGPSLHSAWNALTACRATGADGTECPTEQAAYDARHAAASAAAGLASTRLRQFSDARHEWFIARESVWPQH